MCLHHLGTQIDIHGGGNDLVFPHHENEKAQTESLTGESFAKYWVHNGMVEFAGGKMSKSVGNLVTLDAFLSNYDADVFRMMVLSSGHRLPLKFADDLVHSTKQKLARLGKAIDPVDKPLNTLSDPALPQDCKDLVCNS